MAPPVELLVTEQVVTEIRAAALRGREARLEYGGSLVAVEIDGDTLVAYALPTGPRADQGGGHIRTDADFQNTALHQVRGQYPKLEYAGDWHVHPMWMPNLSGTDRRTAESILRDPDYQHRRLVLILGTVDPGGRPEVVAFVASIDPNRGLRIDTATLRIIAPDSPRIEERIGSSLIPLAELLALPVAAAPHPTNGGIARDTCSHEAALRIGEDLDEIRSRLCAEATLRETDELLVASIRRGNRGAVVLFPPEYPLGAPQVFAGFLEEGRLLPIGLPFAWSSRHPLIDPVREALDRSPPPPRPPYDIDRLVNDLPWPLRLLGALLLKEGRVTIQRARDAHGAIRP